MEGLRTRFVGLRDCCSRLSSSNVLPRRLGSAWELKGHLVAVSGEGTPGWHGVVTGFDSQPAAGWTSPIVCSYKVRRSMTPRPSVADARCGWNAWPRHSTTGSSGAFGEG